MRSCKWMIATVLVLLTAQSYAKVELNLSEPKAAARTFIKALAQGDMETAKAAAIANEKQQQWIESLSRMMNAYQGLDKAMVEKFGKPSAEEAAMDFFASMREENMLAELEKMRVEIKDDTARLLPPKEEGETDTNDLDQNMVLKKVDGQWKVDIASIGDAEMGNIEQGKQFAALLKRLTSGVKDGKYKSREEVMQALMTGAMSDEAPTSAPAPTVVPKDDGGME